MEKTYKCIKEFSIDLRDEEECLIENETFTIPVNSVWWECENASISDIRLENETEWIEISEETLNTYFVGL